MLSYIYQYTNLITAQLDYEPITGVSVVFQPEDTEHIINIQIVSDGVLENDEQFLLELTLSDDQHLCHNQSTTQDIVTVTVLNDDGMITEYVKHQINVNVDYCPQC